MTTQKMLSVMRKGITKYKLIKDGDKIEADLDNGVIYNRTTGESYQTQPFPEFIQKIIANGGLVSSIQKGEIK